MKQKCKDFEEEIKYLESEANEEKMIKHTEHIERLEKEVNVKSELLSDSEIKREFIQTQLQQIKLKFSKSEEALMKSLENNKLNEVIIENTNIELKKVQSNCESCKENNN